MPQFRGGTFMSINCQRLNAAACFEPLPSMSDIRFCECICSIKGEMFLLDVDYVF
jgi:hypothetical protein